LRAAAPLPPLMVQIVLDEDPGMVVLVPDTGVAPVRRQAALARFAVRNGTRVHITDGDDRDRRGGRVHEP
jgi:hypothetical protein